MNYILEGENLAKGVKLSLKLLVIPSAENDFKPRFLQSDTLVFVVAILLLARIVSVGFFVPWPQNFFFADITKIDLVNLLNQDRQSLGLNALSDNTKLDEAAMLKAKDMVANGYFAHQSPAGITPWHWFKKVDYNYKYAGENLAVGFVDSTEVFNAWLNSPEHKANLQNPNYQDVGTAVLSGFGDNNTMIVVQVFGSLPAGGAVAKPPVAINKVTPPAPTPAPVTIEVPIVIEAPAKIETPVIAQVPQTVAPNPDLQKVLGQSVIIQAAATAQSANNGMYYYLLNFIAYGYQNIIRYFSYAMLLAVSVAFLINLLANLNVARGLLMAKSLVLIGVLYATTFINQGVILQLLPHSIKI